MRLRTALKILIVLLALVCLLLSLQYTHKVNSEDMHQGLRAITFAIMALVFAVSYRYIED